MEHEFDPEDRENLEKEIKRRLNYPSIIITELRDFRTETELSLKDLNSTVGRGNLFLFFILLTLLYIAFK